MTLQGQDLIHYENLLLRYCIYLCAHFLQHRVARSYRYYLIYFNLLLSIIAIDILCSTQILRPNVALFFHPYLDDLNSLESERIKLEAHISNLIYYVRPIILMIPFISLVY